MNSISRRVFLGSGLLSLFGCRAFDTSGPATRSTAEEAARTLLVDIHTHLFGTGDSGSGCRMSPKITEGLLFKLLTGLLGVKKQDSTFDAGYVDVLLRQFKGSGLDRIVLLAQDGVYDDRGEFDEERTHVYTPNDYLFDVVSRHEGRLVPCISINPDRRDCVEELDRCHGKGARILKIHPPIQGVDVADRKHTEFFARCAELDMVVMVHTGHEHSAPVINPHLSDPLKLALALEEGCTVVACHCGTGWPAEKPDFFPGFVQMMHRYERLWGDTAVLGTARRVAAVKRLIHHEDLLSRLLHGSDFPFPSSPFAFRELLGLERAVRLQSETNLLKRDLELKAALGFERAGAERVHRLLTSHGA